MWALFLCLVAPKRHRNQSLQTCNRQFLGCPYLHFCQNCYIKSTPIPMTWTETHSTNFCNILVLIRWPAASTWPCFHFFGSFRIVYLRRIGCRNFFCRRHESFWDNKQLAKPVLYLPTYLHTYIHKYVPMYIPTYICTYIPHTYVKKGNMFWQDYIYLYFSTPKITIYILVV
jgi:hypothetical protein